MYERRRQELDIKTNIKAKIKSFAASLGLPLVGVTSAEPLAEEEKIFTRRQEEGTYPPLAEQRMPRRTRPAALLSEVRSIISLAAPYFTDPITAIDRLPEAGVGVIARYAINRDYHAVWREKLHRLTLFIKAQLRQPVNTKFWVDSGPPPEKALAQKAGLGYVGKNTLLYTALFGSFVHLGELYTSVDLEPDPPCRREECGACRRCLSACPSGALSAPYFIRAELCLSYLTQMRGPIPREKRRLLGNHLWGCDVCQEVCPRNQSLSAAPAVPLSDPLLPRFLPAADILRLSEEEYIARFGSTAIGWRPVAVLQRNAAICLGNCGDPRYIPVLATSLRENPHPMVRGASAWALGAIGGREAHLLLLKAKSREHHAQVLEEIEAAL
ncbi:MAG TPA: tRNA epoxyqueuosine(34) reductase QueG [Firmicutes bacterium]|nr:tRNA epoxyqueuosine(34) reductase QueG [Bacillota bacterium]